MQCVTLHPDGPLQHSVALAEEAHAHMTTIALIAERLDETGVGQLAHQQRDPRLRAVQLASESALDGSVATSGGDDEQQVVALLRQPQAGEGLAHDGLGLGECAAKLSHECDVGQGIPGQLRALGRHALNVHVQHAGCLRSAAAGGRR
jgi:hypothetical protein